MKIMKMRIEEIIAKILDIAPEKINDASGPANTENWDSFNALLIAAEIEKKFGVNLSVEEIASIKNVGDIKSLLKSHGAKYF